MTALPFEPQTMADVERAREAHLRLRAMQCAPQAPERARPRAVKGCGLPTGRIKWALPPASRPDPAAPPADSMDASGDDHDEDHDGEPEPAVEAYLDEAEPVDDHPQVAEPGCHVEGERRISLALIIRTVADHYGVSAHDILSQRRTHAVVLPRQVVMYLAKDLTLFSLPSIGRLKAGRDHTTILHGVRKIEGLMPDDYQLTENVLSIKAEILRRAGA